MTRFNKAHLIFFLLIFCCLFSYSSLAETKASKLKHLIRKIDTLKADLSETKKEQNEVQKQLKKTEIEIGKYAIVIKNTGKKLAQENLTLKILHLKRDNYLKKLAQEKYNFASLLREAYMIEKHNYIKAFLNQENIDAIDRMYVYYSYLLKSRDLAMRDILLTLKGIQKNDKAIKHQTKILSGLYTQNEQEQTKLKKMREKRGVTLREINANIKVKNIKLKKLIADKISLEVLIKKLRLNKKKSTIPINLTTFCSKLFSPINGKIEKTLQSGEATLNGVIIPAESLHEVYAIAPGRVIFSDWLSGYGLMLIIDHDNGFMSIYGRNNSLYKKTGETVKGGDLIATVGESGGHSQPGLYFAMRFNGNPINVKTFCNRKKIKL